MPSQTTEVRRGTTFFPPLARKNKTRTAMGRRMLPRKGAERNLPTIENEGKKIPTDGG